MRFIHPEYLWALALLLLPVIVHLFRLRKFKTTPFTNVPFLKEIIAESRKSKSLKKWLLLCTRLLMLAALVMAFARPYLEAKEQEVSSNVLIYLDNSRSMELKKGERSLLQHAVEDLLAFSPEQEFTLFTNDQEFREVRISDIRNELIDLGYSAMELSPEEVALKIRRQLEDSGSKPATLFLVSDFQHAPRPILAAFDPRLVVLRPEAVRNIKLDTAWVAEKQELKIRVSRLGNYTDTPVSVYNGDTLIAKAAVSWQDEQEKELSFTLPQNKDLFGRIVIGDNGLQFDNEIYISLRQKQPIRILSIGESIQASLGRIFSGSDFEFESTRLAGLNFATLADHDMIILDHLSTLPAPLSEALLNFQRDGGMVVLLPAADTEPSAYNSLLASAGLPRLSNYRKDTVKITGINYDHPFFEGIFQARTQNFAYPEAYGYYPLSGDVRSLLKFQGEAPFLAGSGNLFLFTAPLDPGHNTLTQSPLIVPAFYALGVNSRKTGQLYYIAGAAASLDVPGQLGGDRILHLKNGRTELIPRQQDFANKTRLDFSGITPEAGIYKIMQGEQVLGSVSFNYDRSESALDYPNPSLEGLSRYSDLGEALQAYENASRLEELWKWFVILALLFLLAETAIQKFLK